MGTTEDSQSRLSSAFKIANGIQKCLDTGDYSSSFEKIKYIFVDIGSRSF